MIVEKISALPEEKLQQLGKIIDKLEKAQSIDEYPKSARGQPQPYMFKVETGMMSNQSARPVSGKSKKKEKATSLHDCIIGNKRNNANSPKNT